MKERSRQLFSREEAQPPEGERPERARKKHRVTQRLENIYQAQARLEVLERPPLPFSEQRLTAGGLAALRMLGGVAIAPAGLLLRRIEPHLGSIVAYQGTQLFMRGAMHALNRIWPETRGRVEERVGKKKGRKGAAAKELLSEGALEAKIREISTLTKGRQKEFREYRRAYSATRKAGIIPEESREKASENYLRGYIEYLDQLIDGQQSALEGEGGQEGLIALARSLESYHRGIVETHHERVDTVGTAGASLVLLVNQHVMHGSPFTSETIAALASGIIPLISASIQRKGKREARSSYVETINREIDELKKHRLAVTLKLARLEEKRLQHKEKEGKSEVGKTVDVQLSPEEQREIDDIMAVYRNAIQDIVAHTPSDQQTIGVPPYASAVISPSERGALSGFLGMTLPQPAQEAPVLPVGVVPIERPERAITPPPFEQIESSSLRREVDPNIIVDLMNIAGRGLTMPTTSSIGWVDAPNVVYSVFVEDPDQDISDEALDEAIRYLDELNDRLTAHNSVRNFQHEHLAKLIALRGDMQTRLYSRERAGYRDLILHGRPSTLRATILRRSRIADVPDDQSNDISQEQFEEGIRQWLQRKSTRGHDRSSLRKFLAACQETLDAIPSHMSTRDEKAHIVKRAGEVLDEFLPEVAMPDPEHVSAWNRRIDEISAHFNRVQSASNYERRQRVPELLAGEPFVPSDVLREVRFAQGHLEDFRIKLVDTRGILGSYVDRAAWIVQDRARIAELAAPLIQTPTPEVLQNFFMSRVRRGDQEHLEENIQLLRISGPKGPIHFVYRGIQHVAAARVAGLPRIIARVYELGSHDLVGNKVVTTKYRDRYEEWLELKKAGLIDGELASQKDLANQYVWFTPIGSDREETLTPVVAKIRFQTVPWLIWFNEKPHDGAPMRSISEITELYRQLYAPPQGSTETGPLDKLKTADGRKLEPKYLTEFKDLHSLITRKGVRTA